MQDYNVGHFGFSAMNPDDLEASAFTLVTIVLDVSGSTENFRQEMTNCLKEIIRSCQRSERVDNLLIRLVTFGDDVTEIHGFKSFADCNLDDYNNVLRTNGMTALYDAVINSVQASTLYGEQLVDTGCDCNAVVFVVTDGANNASSFTIPRVKETFAEGVSGEKIESLLSILVGINIHKDPTLTKLLKEFKDEAGFTQYEEIENADKGTMAKLAEFASKSVTSQSQKVGSGQPSQPLKF